MGEMAKSFELSLDLFFKEVDQRAHAFEAPPEDFNPLIASRAQLEFFGLPPRPDENKEPELFRLWARLLDKPLKIVATEFPKVVNGRHPPVPANRVGRNVRPGFQRFQRSRNWSGGCLTAEHPNRLVHVSGTWQVPDVSLPPVLPHRATKGDEFQSSVWVGIDGRRRYPTSSMPQIGTSQCLQIVDGIEKKKAYAWWQWWSLDENYPPDNRNNPPVPIPNIEVSVHDEIIAGLTLLHHDEVQFFIKNQTTGLFTTFVVVAPGRILPLGSTAEWIVERPTVIGSHRLYPLPSYTDVVFRDCLAQSAASIGAPATAQQLDRLQFIRMTDIFPDPHRTSFVSVARKEDDRSICVRYRDASAPGSGGLLS